MPCPVTSQIVANSMRVKLVGSLALLTSSVKTAVCLAFVSSVRFRLRYLLRVRTFEMLAADPAEGVRVVGQEHGGALVERVPDGRCIHLHGLKPPAPKVLRFTIRPVPTSISINAVRLWKNRSSKQPRHRALGAELHLQMLQQTPGMQWVHHRNRRSVCRPCCSRGKEEVAGS